MRRSFFLASTVLILSLTMTGVSKAGPFQDDLVRCIFDRTSPSDEIVLARWMVASFATHDGVRDLVDLKPEAVESTSKQFAVLVNRIVLEDCSQEMKRAAKAEGAPAIVKAFEVFGNSASRSILKEENVAKAFQIYLRHFDSKGLDRLIAE